MHDNMPPFDADCYLACRRRDSTTKATCLPLIATAVVLFAFGCGGGGDGKSVGCDPRGAGATYGTATLRPNVVIFTDAQVAAIESMTADAWTIRGAITATPGDILLADMSAVKVVSVSSSGGQTRLSVAPADVEDVFSQISLASDLRLDEGVLTSGAGDPGTTGATGALRSALSADGGADGGATEGIDLSVGAQSSIAIHLSRPPFSGTLTFSVGGRLTFDYDAASPARGAASVTGDLGGTARVDSTDMATIAAEKRIGIGRIPVPFTIVDSAQRYLGIRVASIVIPISFGAEATASYGIAVELTAQESADFSSSYEAGGGFSTTGPTFSGSVGLSAELPGTGPPAVFRTSLEDGVFVRARPQLLILNQVASVGADLKSGLYCEGTASATLTPPYYCIDGQGHLKGEAFAFFKATGISEKDSPSISKDIPSGPRYLAGGCSMDGGSASSGDGSGDAAADGAAGGGSGGPGGEDRLPAPPPIGALWTGDPHLLTFDGVRYDCQPAGEVTMVVSRSGDLEVQARTEPWGSKDVSLAVAVAARVTSDRVAFYLDGTVTIDGAVATLPPGPMALPGGGVLWALPDGYVLVWPDNSQLRLSSYGFFFGVDVFLPTSRAGQVSGLLGNANGVADDDLTTRDAATKLVSPASFAEFYKTYVESWRIAQDTSLFDYPAGTSTETFTDRSFPRLLATAKTLDGATVQANTAICQSAGVSGDWMDACVLDLAMTSGDVRFAQALATARWGSATFEIQPPYTGPPAITGVFPQIILPGNSVTIVGTNLATVSDDTGGSTVTLVGAGEGGQVTIALPVASGSAGQLTVVPPPTAFQQVSGGATIFVTTPEGTSSVGSPVTIALSNPFGGRGDAGGDGLFASVYALQLNTARLPNFGSVDSLTDPCDDPSVIAVPANGTACPLTTFDVPNLDVASQNSAAGLPGLPHLTQWFAIRFRGVLTIDTPGSYRFETLSDDGSNAYLIDLASGAADGGSRPLMQVVSNDGAHGFSGGLGPSTTLASRPIRARSGLLPGRAQRAGNPAALAGAGRDHAGHRSSEQSASAGADVVFDAAVRGPVSGFVLTTTDATARPSGGSLWDAVAG